MTHRRTRITLLIVAGLVAPSLCAQDPPPPRTRFNGMLELSVGRTKSRNSCCGGPGTASAGIGAGVWLADRVLTGIEVRTHGTIDIEESGPGVRYVQATVRARLRSLHGADVGLGVGPAWVKRSASTVRSSGYTLTFTLPFHERMDKPAFAIFGRYSRTAAVERFGSISTTTVGLRFDLRGDNDSR